jgi:RNA polymerase sigma-70 factor, ECF subfamily
MQNPRKEFGNLYDNYIDKIYRFIFLKVSSIETAEDLTSETFLRGWEVYENRADTLENPQAFLYQIARNLVIDHYRQKGRNQSISADQTPLIDPRMNLEKSAEKNSDLMNIRHAIADLKDDYQNVLIWHYLDDLPVKEVAKLIDKSEDNTRVLLHRALKSLKKTIQS